ncbi:MAG: glycosyltransferase family 4 protein [Shewanella sp.]
MTTQQPHTVVLMLDSRSQGGIETHVVELAKGLVRANLMVRVCFMRRYDAEHPIAAALKHAGATVDYLPSGVRALYGYLATIKPWILHTHGYKAGILGRIIAKWQGIATISTYHAGEISHGKLGLYDVIDRYSHFLANEVLSVSQEIAMRLPLARAHVFRNFIDTEHLPLSCGQQVAFVGRLSHEKGGDRIIEFARALPKIDFHIYGDGPDAKGLQAVASSNVHFHGFCQMSQHWQNIGLMVMPSRHEGLPMAALEAMARGIPVAATKVGDLSQLINNGMSGYVVAEPDYLQLIQAIEHWLQLTPSQRLLLGQTAKTKIEQEYSLIALMPSMLALYHQAHEPVSSS